MRITAGYSHVEVSPLQRTLNMKGSRKRTQTLLCSLCVKGATLPCANNRRLFAHRRVHPFMCNLGSRRQWATSREQCANNHRLFAREGRTCGAMCEQPPVNLTLKGPDPGGHVRTTAGYSHIEGARPRGSMCEQPPVIRTWKGWTQEVMCEQPPVIRT